MSVIQQLKIKWYRRRNRKTVYASPTYWDEKAVEMDGSSMSMWENKALNQMYQTECQNILAKAIEGLSPGRLLDLGCGTGRLSRFFSEREWQVTALDFSEQTLTIARAIPHVGDIEFRQRSILELDYTSEFDLAVAWGVVVFACPDANALESFFMGLKCACKPGATVILQEPIHNNFLHRVLKMSVDEFIAIMEKAGFEIESIRNMHFWPTRLLLCYFNIPGWITRPIYALGQWMLALTGYRMAGDYKAIVAKAPEN